MAALSTAQRIRNLAKQGKSTREIVDVVYNLPKGTHHTDRDRRAAYVRVVLRQRILDSGRSAWDNAYCARKRAEARA